MATLTAGALRPKADAPRAICVVLATLLIGCSLAEVARSAEVSDKMSRQKVFELIVETPEIEEVSIAPDGGFVAYTVVRGSVAKNEVVTDLWLQELDGMGAPRGEAIKLDSQVEEGIPGRFNIAWRPRARALTYHSVSKSTESGATSPGGAASRLMLYDLGSRSASEIPLRDQGDSAASPESGEAQGLGRPPIKRIPASYRWSPTGQTIAFIAAKEERGRLNPRAGVQATLMRPGGLAEGRAGLFLLDVATGALTLASPDSLHVMQFNWAPDGGALAVAATPEADDQPLLRADLFVVDPVRRTARPLVTQPGLDSNPYWSPDGKWIAFSTQSGRPNYSYSWPAIVPAGGGEVVRLNADGNRETMGMATRVFWQADSHAFYYDGGRNLAIRFLRADTVTRRVTLTPAEDESYEDRFRLSDNGRWLAYTKESPAMPPELFVRGFPEGKPHSIIRLATDYPLSAEVRSDRLTWKTGDGKFTLHGVLLTPKTAWRPGEPKRPRSPLPTLIYLEGGPSMVKAGFSTDGYAGAMLALAAQGYAVFAPNTRGRPGCGEDCHLATSVSGSQVRLPYEDTMAAVDHLIAEGVADPDRLGVYGLSNGGVLASYVITQTNRFRAAEIYESVSFDLLMGSAKVAPGGTIELLLQMFNGRRDPFDPQDRNSLIADSPGLNMNRVTTPTLLSFGAKASAGNVGVPLFNNFNRFKVPADLVIYDSGHSISRPAARVDHLTRTAAWFDYWIRGMPYPDKSRAQEFEQWRTERQALMRKPTRN